MSVISRRELLQIAAGVTAARATRAPAQADTHPTSANGALPDDSKVNWRLAALVESYPWTNASTPPPLADGQSFEVRLPQASWRVNAIWRSSRSRRACPQRRS
jgi:hypothetical protein